MRGWNTEAVATGPAARPIPCLPKVGRGPRARGLGCGLISLLALLLPAVLHAEVADDPMVPQSDPSEAIVSPLRFITIVTTEPGSQERFLSGALDWQRHEFLPAGEAEASLRSHWGMRWADPFTVALYAPARLDSAVVVRVVESAAPLAVSRPGHASHHLGPLGYGFPGDNLDQRTRVVEHYGFRSTAGVTRMNFKRADGSEYAVGEVHYAAPEGVLVLGVDRGDKMPIGATDPIYGRGGAAYTSVLVSDAAESARFLTDVLGLERRRSMTFQSSGPGGGMVGMDQGEEVLFEQWFSPGSRTGYVVLMQLLDGNDAAPVAPDMNSRGISMLSFETAQIDAVIERWNRYDPSRPVAVREMVLPGVGPVRAVTVPMPDGLPVEIYEPVGDTGSAVAIAQP